MKPLNAILTTVALCSACALIASLRWGLLPCFLMQIVLAIWAFADAKEIGMAQCKQVRFGPSGPWTAAWAILTCWFLSFGSVQTFAHILLRGSDRGRFVLRLVCCSLFGLQDTERREGVARP
jgi:hypothetical protein